MEFPRLMDLDDIRNVLAQLGSLGSPANPFEVSPFHENQFFDVHDRDRRPVVGMPDISLAPVPEHPIEFWNGNPEDPFWPGEDRHLNPATEVIGWYCGYHNHRPDQWGIYIRERAVTAVAQRIHARMARRGRCDLTVTEVRALVFDKVWHHEYFHHIVEAAMTRLELRHGIQLDDLRRRRYRDLREGGRFIFEEMCANAHAIEHVSRQIFDRPDGHYRSTWALDALMDWMRHQPEGYNAFDRAIGPVNWIRALEGLAEEVLHEIPRLHREFLHDLLDDSPGDGRRMRTGQYRVPLFLVDRL